MFLFDRARRRARWGRVLPLLVLSSLLGLTLALGLESLGLIPRWLLAPLGNGFGFVLMWLWLPNAFKPHPPVPVHRRVIAGVLSAVVFIWAVIAASWNHPLWLQ
ncbi:MAG TPA: hypothetical protein VGQ69_16455 [Gemmatimonadales bacterium]|jgi:hypothetical protein|nr:hypothetical protein [Gemmatimonadales bacterium]